MWEEAGICYPAAGAVEVLLQEDRSKGGGEKEKVIELLLDGSVVREFGERIVAPVFETQEVDAEFQVDGFEGAHKLQAIVKIIALENLVVFSRKVRPFPEKMEEENLVPR